MRAIAWMCTALNIDIFIDAQRRTDCRIDPYQQRSVRLRPQNVRTIGELSDDRQMLAQFDHLCRAIDHSIRRRQHGGIASLTQHAASRKKKYDLIKRPTTSNTLSAIQKIHQVITSSNNKLTYALSAIR